jgi:dephospho-CoA kinase
LARDVVTPGKPAWREIIRHFGQGILNPDRTINRQTLAAIVFGNRTKLRRLERIIHPRVAREQARLTRQAAQQDPGAVVVYDVPLLFEAGIDTRVDKIVVVAADRETQIARLKKRNQLSRAEAIRRIRSQMPVAQKVRSADVVIDGTLRRQAIMKAVRSLYRDFLTPT